METLAEWTRTAGDFLLPPLQAWLLGTKDEPGHVISILTILIVGSIMYYVGGRVVTRSVKKLVGTARHREWHKKDIEKRQNTLAGLFLNVWRIIVFVVILYALLKEFVPDVDRMLAPLFASAGIIGVAIGFGAQSMIKDFLSGIFIISENQYRVGDIVDIEGFSGTVERIGTRSTVIRDVDGNVHYFPNGMVMHVINKTMGYSMARFIISVHPSSDIEEVSTIVNTLGEELAGEEKWKPKIIEPPAFVSVGEVTGNAVEIIIAGKTQPSDQWAVIAEMRRRLLATLEDAGIELAVLPMMANQPAKK